MMKAAEIKPGMLICLPGSTDKRLVTAAYDPATREIPHEIPSMHIRVAPRAKGLRDAGMCLSADDEIQFIGWNSE